MSGSPLPQTDTLTEDHLQSLINNSVLESTCIEYKRNYTPKSDPDEFIKDVLAFANTDGGDIVLGLTDKPTPGDAPVSVMPSGLNADAVKLQILDMIRMQSRPPFTDLSVLPVPLKGGGSAVVVRIKKSYGGPHFKVNDGRFYRRRDGGRVLMEHEQIRAAFSGRDELFEKYRKFRDKRCDLVVKQASATETFVAPSVILQVCSSAVANSDYHLPVSTIAKEKRHFSGEQGIGWGHVLINIGGILRTEDVRSHWAAVLQEGACEFRTTRWHYFSSGQNRIRHTWMEDGLSKQAGYCWQILEHLRLPKPYVVFVSHMFVDGYTLPVGDADVEVRPIRFQHLYCKELVLQDKPESFHAAMFPVFNELWNASGLMQSLNFDANGVWLGKS